MPPTPITPAPAELTAAPGLKHFAVVEPKLAGGSLPSAKGLDWLVEKGYKTILDLRESSDVQPSFLAEVSNRGLRYISLPITVKTVNTEHVSRFNFELSVADARPLYFCDTNGTRAGVLWYVHRISVDKVDPQVASHEAEDLGLSDKSFWQAASTYLESLKPAKTPLGPPRVEPAAPSPKAKAETTVAPSGTSDLSQQDLIIPATTVDARDPTAWSSYTALVVTGLGVPLAYLGRSVISFRPGTRASLQGPGRQPRSLPRA